MNNKIAILMIGACLSMASARAQKKLSDIPVSSTGIDANSSFIGVKDSSGLKIDRRYTSAQFADFITSLVSDIATPPGGAVNSIQVNDGTGGFAGSNLVVTAAGIGKKDSSNVNVIAHDTVYLTVAANGRVSTAGSRLEDVFIIGNDKTGSFVAGVGRGGVAPINDPYIAFPISGSTNSTTPIMMNSAGNFLINNFSSLQLNKATDFPIINNNVGNTTGGNCVSLGPASTFQTTAGITLTTGNLNILNVPFSNGPNTSFAPISGNASFACVNLAPVINQTNTANGATRAMEIAPTLTAVGGSFVGIETNVNPGGGSGTVYTEKHLGTAPSYYNQNLLLGSTTNTGDRLQVTGNINLTTAGNKFKIATGTNASLGTITLVSGTATITSTAITAASKILITRVNPIGTIGDLSVPSATTISGSAVINSASASDASTVNYFIIN